jgi:hypothetical protein
MNKPKTVTLGAEKLISEALAIEAEAAADAGALGFMGRTLIQATLPHRKVEGNEFSRTNGNLTLTMLAPSKIGLPYGSIPRLLLAYVTREAIRTQSPEIYLGDSMSAFMRELGLWRRGGPRGDITRLKDQTQRLFACSISAIHTGGGKRGKIINRPIADEADLWWDPVDPEQSPEWKARVTLYKRFFDEVVTDPVPVDMRALQALKQSPLALDIYCWLTHRVSYLMKPTTIPWAALALQFGSDYTRARDFKAAFVAELHNVLIVYPKARARPSSDGLTINPSPPHIPWRPLP